MLDLKRVSGNTNFGNTVEKSFTQIVGVQLRREARCTELMMVGEPGKCRLEFVADCLVNSTMVGRLKP